MALSYHLKASSVQNQGVPFSLIWVMELSIFFLGKVKVFPIILVCQLVDVQLLHENGK